ncbi:S-adenosyl-L-methionine-dependent methyltransferase [Chytridium lagenaria]|nr:S-adenosyl-L-methionine-dependent methyltransferase [Chytridium lagenaria]
MSFWIGVLVGVFSPFLLFVLARLLTRSKEVYGNDQDLLNFEVKTHWFNMGFWKHTTSFAIACSDLASLVSNETFQDFDNIIDFGSGCGDQLLLWGSRFPNVHIWSVTSEAVQAQLSSKKVRHNRLESRIHVFQGDAIKLKSWVDVSDSTRGLQDRQYDVATSVDSAYHFGTCRNDFFSLCSMVLKTSGRLSLADIIGGEGKGFWPNQVLNLFCLMSKAPRRNLVSEEVYRQTLGLYGFESVEVEDISENVFNPLASFVQAQSSSFKHILSLGSRLQFFFITSFLTYLYKHRMLRFVIVKACRK